MTQGLLDYDREHLWHPYTSMATPTPVRLVTSASGVRLTVSTGSTNESVEVIDAMSSWWSAIHGYNHPKLNAAVTGQLDQMAHVMFGGLTHEPAIRLGQRLLELSGLDHIFLADSGSVSVEVALKMALQYQRGIGRPERTTMLTVRGGYHGDTCGCMGVCDPDGGMHAIWRGFLPEHVFADRPPARGGDVAAWAESVEELAAAEADGLAGIIIEPLLQGAGGMWAYDAECLQVLREIADRHDLVLIFDEIATAFGRVGGIFAADVAGVRPDVMCVGKALTGGYLTLAAAMCTSKVADGISASEAGVLMHGPTFMGNPLACATALANLDLLESSDLTATISRINQGLTSGLAAAADLPNVVDVRTLGAVGVIQLDAPVDVVAATDAALAAGVWVRPFRDLIYTMPPYICSDEELAQICTAMIAAASA